MRKQKPLVHIVNFYDNFKSTPDPIFQTLLEQYQRASDEIGFQKLRDAIELRLDELSVFSQVARDAEPFAKSVYRVGRAYRLSDEGVAAVQSHVADFFQKLVRDQVEKLAESRLHRFISEGVERSLSHTQTEMIKALVEAEVNDRLNRARIQL